VTKSVQYKGYKHLIKYDKTNTSLTTNKRETRGRQTKYTNSGYMTYSSSVEQSTDFRGTFFLAWNIKNVSREI